MVWIFKRNKKNSITPIIILSARSDDTDKVLALDSGANDYVTKPFSSVELMARIRTVLRGNSFILNARLRLEGKFVLDKLTIDYDTRQVFLNENEIKLTQTEYNILSLLSKSSGKLLTYSTIVREIWGFKDEGSIKNSKLIWQTLEKS